MSSQKLKTIAEETMQAIKNKKYRNPFGKIIKLDELVKKATGSSKLYKPDWEFKSSPEINKKPKISITRESTLEAAYRLSDDNACILNFASAIWPGGGFLQGASAQEESIARSSALYSTLIQHPEFYEENKRSQKDNIGLYLDYAIYSPNVPLFRNDRGDWLDEPYLTSVLTSPAPNRTAILTEDPEGSDDLDKIELVFEERMDQVLKIMAENKHRTIVLGAWGCGAFGNDPFLVAEKFREAIENNQCFDNIIFAIYDRPDSVVFHAFVSEFSGF